MDFMTPNNLFTRGITVTLYLTMYCKLMEDIK